MECEIKNYFCFSRKYSLETIAPENKTQIISKMNEQVMEIYWKLRS